MVSCEVFVKDYMPVVRAFMVKELYNNYGMSQMEIAGMLGITQPAISQYLRGYRGTISELSSEIQEAIKQGSENLYKNHMKNELNAELIQKEFCKICEMLKVDGETLCRKPRIAS